MPQLSRDLDEEIVGLAGRFSVRRVIDGGNGRFPDVAASSLVPTRSAKACSPRTCRPERQNQARWPVDSSPLALPARD